VNLLPDTHLLIRASAGREYLPAEAQDLMGDPTNALFFSVASIWETAIKHALKRADFATDPAELRRQLLDNGYVELSVLGPHATAVAGLPLVHRDPFDRLLVAQAMVESITLLTADPVLTRYPAPVRLVR
jgi:PIN domain nuclease of toxin-antitoxin system